MDMHGSKSSSSLYLEEKVHFRTGWVQRSQEEAASTERKQLKPALSVESGSLRPYSIAFYAKQILELSTWRVMI